MIIKEIIKVHNHGFQNIFFGYITKAFKIVAINKIIAIKPLVL